MLFFIQWLLIDNAVEKTNIQTIQNCPINMEKDSHTGFEQHMGEYNMRHFVANLLFKVVA